MTAILGTRGKKTIMVVSAHPADPFDLAGGTLALHRQAGDRVVILSITPGARSHAPKVYAGDRQVGLTAEEEANLYAETVVVKKDEFQQACDVIGAEMICLDYVDEPLTIVTDIICEIAQHYRAVRPDVLITHHETEAANHDHPDAGVMAVRAVTTAARWLRGSSLEPHLIPQVYFFMNQFRSLTVSLHAAIPVPPTHVVNVESVISEKIEMLKKFATQAFGGMGYDSKEYAAFRFNAVEGAVGLQRGLRYAEEFVALHPTKVDLL